MIAIYDFDGTLTPYSLPQYQVLKQCGYTDEDIKKRIGETIQKGETPEFYVAYYRTYMDILAENEIPMTRNNVCLGARDTKFNSGVEEYFKKFQSSKTGIKNYIVTSGIKDYVDETVIRPLVDGAYGVTFKEEDGIYTGVDLLLSDKMKIDVIKHIQKNGGTNDIVYFGDGLTDKYAFEYVHRIGGRTVFVASSEHSQENYNKLNENGIIDEYFSADFSPDSEISKFIQEQITTKRDDIRRRSSLESNKIV